MVEKKNRPQENPFLHFNSMKNRSLLERRKSMSIAARKKSWQARARLLESHFAEFVDWVRSFHFARPQRYCVG